MEFKIIFSIRHFLLQDLDYIETPLFTIHSHVSVREKFIDDLFKSKLGIKALQSFENNLFAFKIVTVEPEVDEKSEAVMKLNVETYSKAEAIKTFLFFLWFVKDNSISVDETYGYETMTHQFACFPNHTISSNASGLFENVAFSNEEIDRATNIMFKYIEVCPGETIDAASEEFFSDSSIGERKDVLKNAVNSNNELNNLQRAITFLSTARSTPHLPYKIALYMPILESLFSDIPDEVTQKVSERVAFYVGKDKAERIEIFKTVKSAYDVRSRFLHGQKLSSNKSKPDYLKPLSVRVDEIIRTVLTKIVMEDSDKFLQKDTKDFLSQIIFQ
jgi:hypothetical protein